MLAPGEAPVPTASERFQFQIKHMLIGTFVFAVALSPLRVVLPEAKFEYVGRDGQMFFIIGVAIVVNLITTLPCLWGGFLSTACAVAMGLGWLLYCLLVTGLEFGTLCLVLGAPGSERTDPIELRVYRGADGSFTLYEDEGDSYRYEKGVYATIPIQWKESSKTLAIGARAGEFPGMLKQRTFRVVWVRPGRGTGPLAEKSADAEVRYEGKPIEVPVP